MLLNVSLVLVVAGQLAMLFLAMSLEKRVRKCEEECRYLSYLYQGMAYQLDYAERSCSGVTDGEGV